jgi:hypothetical protein
MMLKLSKLLSLLWGSRDTNSVTLPWFAEKKPAEMLLPVGF